MKSLADFCNGKGLSGYYRNPLSFTFTLLVTLPIVQPLPFTNLSEYPKRLPYLAKA